MREWPLKQWKRNVRNSSKMKEGRVYELFILPHSPVVIAEFVASKGLHKLFVVGNHNELEVALLAANFNDPNKQNEH